MLHGVVQHSARGLVALRCQALFQAGSGRGRSRFGTATEINIQTHWRGFVASSRHHLLRVAVQQKRLTETAAVRITAFFRGMQG